MLIAFRSRTSFKGDRGGARSRSGSWVVISWSVAKQPTNSVPALVASMMKPGVGLIQSGMRIAWLAEINALGLVALGNNRITLPSAWCKKQYK